MNECKRSDRNNGIFNGKAEIWEKCVFSLKHKTFVAVYNIFACAIKIVPHFHDGN